MKVKTRYHLTLTPAERDELLGLLDAVNQGTLSTTSTDTRKAELLVDEMYRALRKADEGKGPFDRDLAALSGSFQGAHHPPNRHDDL